MFIDFTILHRGMGIKAAVDRVSGDESNHNCMQCVHSWVCV